MAMPRCGYDLVTSTTRFLQVVERLLKSWNFHGLAARNGRFSVERPDQNTYLCTYHGLVLAWYVMVAQLIDVQILRSSVHLGAVTNAALLIVIFVLLIKWRESATLSVCKTGCKHVAENAMFGG